MDINQFILYNSSAGHTPQKMRQLYNSELLDIYCSQCCKKVNLLNDLEARLRNLKANRWSTHSLMFISGSDLELSSS